jgi:hypothetical protein
MYTRKQQMNKVNELDFKIDRIESSVEKKVDAYLTEALAEVVQFNRAVLETMKAILNEDQQAEFIDVMSVKIDEIKLQKE